MAWSPLRERCFFNCYQVVNKMRLIYLLVTWFPFHEHVMYVAGESSWFEAQEMCRKNDSVLLRKSMNNSSEFYWTGHYRRMSMWIKISGCYPESVLQTFSLRYDMQQSSAGLCQEICLSSNMTIFAIKGSECRCLQNHPNVNEELPSHACNAACAMGADSHHFEECGGRGAYAVFQSVTGKQRYEKFKPLCVGIHCNDFPQFYMKSDCNHRYKPLCQNCDFEEESTFKTWSEAMKHCKSANTSSYLFSDVFLNDIKRTCTLINEVFTQPSWLGVARELYSGIDRGNEIKEEEREYYHQCFKCEKPNDCTYALCTEQLKGKVYCMKEDNPAKEGIENGVHVTRHHSRTRNCTSEATNITSIPNNGDTPSKNESNILNVVIPVVVLITCLIGGCFTVFLYMRRKQKQKQSAKTTKTGNSEGGIKHQRPDKDLTEEHDYFSLEPQEKSTKVSNILKVHFASPYTDSKDETYDHLRGTSLGPKDDNRENDYDTANKFDAKLEYSSAESTEGNYDHLREKNFKNDDDINNDYSHVLPHASEDSDYDVTTRVTKMEINGIYNHTDEMQIDESTFSRI